MNSFSLKQARLYRAKTQADMAKLLGIHIETYRKLEINQKYGDYRTSQGYL